MELRAEPLVQPIFFTVRSELFSRFVTDFAACFCRCLNMSGESSFFLTGQLFKVIPKLCRCCFVPSYVPKDEAGFELLAFKIEEEKLLPSKDLLDANSKGESTL